jgi:ligand-binding SRPBCC domain-containing protein
MSIHTLHREQVIPAPPEEVFRYFSEAGNLQALTPPFLNFQILTPQPLRLQAGTILDYRLRWYFLPIRWRTIILEWHPPHGFVDVQIKGPYKLWRHSHRFETAPQGTRMVDLVTYELPLGFLGSLAHSLKVRSDVESIFDYRRERITETFENAGRVS